MVSESESENEFENEDSKGFENIKRRRKKISSNESNQSMSNKVYLAGC